MITEQIFDEVAPPLLAAMALATVVQQLELLEEIETDLPESLEKWHAETRANAVRALTSQIQDVRGALNRFERTLPVETPEAPE